VGREERDRDRGEGVRGRARLKLQGNRCEGKRMQGGRERGGRKEERPLGSLLVGRRGGVEGVGEVGVKSDADHPSLLRLVARAIERDGSGMSVEEVVCHEVGFGGTVSSLALRAIAAVARSVDTLPWERCRGRQERRRGRAGKKDHVVGVEGDSHGLVDGQPVLHARAEALEAEVGVALEDWQTPSPTESEKTTRRREREG
jgi:hypothetical protein